MSPINIRLVQNKLWHLGGTDLLNQIKEMSSGINWISYLQLVTMTTLMVGVHYFLGS